MSENIDYKQAYERQKRAREKAEQILENKARELYEINESLLDAYNQLKKQNSQLLHQEKLASIGQLAAGVAHEINNPVGYVISNLHSLGQYTISLQKFFNACNNLQSIDPNDSEAIKILIKNINQVIDEEDVEFIMDDLNELVKESYKGARRIEEIVRGLKSFARKDEVKEEIFCLNDCINNTLKLVWNEIKYHCELNQDFQALKPLVGSPGEINQVILNLLVNAAQSIDGKGEISLTTYYQDGFNYLEISDTGRGIPENILNQIFDPFFTTKEVDQGTGLGLSITHGIITRFGGTINVNSVQGEGTCFKIGLPVDKEYADLPLFSSDFEI